MDELRAWLEAEKEKLNAFANGGDATMADNARNKLNLLAYIESIGNGAKGPEIDVDAIFAALITKIDEYIKGALTSVTEDVAALKQRITVLEQAANAALVNKG